MVIFFYYCIDQKGSIFFYYLLCSLSHVNDFIFSNFLLTSQCFQILMRYVTNQLISCYMIIEWLLLDKRPVADIWCIFRRIVKSLFQNIILGISVKEWTVKKKYFILCHYIVYIQRETFPSALLESPITTRNSLCIKITTNLKIRIYIYVVWMVMRQPSSRDIWLRSIHVK